MELDSACGGQIEAYFPGNREINLSIIVIVLVTTVQQVINIFTT